VSRPARRTLIRGSALVIGLGLAGGVFLAVHGDRAGSPPATSPVAPKPQPSPVPKFAFSLDAVKPIATGKKKDAGAIAHSAAQHIQQTLTRLYVTGFLDPNDWRSGRYTDAWRLFTSDAIAIARRDESTLTLGAQAGRTYDIVMPHAGQLAVRVLMDKYGHPSTAVAIVSFAARAEELNGDKAVIRSGGQYFLRPGPRGWSIYGYQVKRDDAGLPRMAEIQP
jgi:hypothetical protein